MLQPDLLARVRLLAEAYRLPLAVAGDRMNDVVPVRAVEPVVAQVEARLADGRYRVLVAGHRFELALPAEAQPGDRVTINSQALRAAAAQAPATAVAQGTTGAAPSAEPVQARVSDLGRLVGQLAAPDNAPRVPGSITASLPVFPDAPLDTALAAATLRELIALSGLFYESHQAEWVSGMRQTGELLREPQARFAPLSAPPANVTRPQAGSVPDFAPHASMPSSAPAATPAAGAAPAQVAPEAIPVIQQQVNALEARHLVWNGQIWPGQPMRWEIEEAADEAPEAGEPQTVWRTRVVLTLPHLGEVSALLVLGAAGLTVRLDAAQARTESLLAGRATELKDALTRSGIRSSAVVARERHGAA